MSIRTTVLGSAMLAAIAGLAALFGSPDAGARLAPQTDSGLVLAPPRGESETAGPDRGVEADVAFAGSLSRVFRHASRTIEPSVIHIQTSRRAYRTVRDQFGRIVRREDTIPAGVGSGVIVTADGYALTNHHVIDGADEVRVTLSDGREARAELVGSDPGTDLAVLRLEATGLTPARIADSDALEVGDWVVAVGSPFGLDHTVTAGIVSAKGRSGLSPRGAPRPRIDRFEEFIQTDAAVNPGNSGGPLVNLHGELVGINSMIASSGGGSVGISFAIPSAIATSVFENIRETGRVEQGFLGVSDLVNTSDLAADGEANLPQGVYVQTVIEGGPAAAAGLRVGDVITAINGRRTENFNRLRNLVGLTRPGTPITLEVHREGVVLELVARVASERDMRASAQQLREARSQEQRRAFEQYLERETVTIDALGVQAVTYNEAVPIHMPGMPEAGVFVVSVLPETPASALNINTGDLILGINGRSVRTAQQLEGAMRSADLNNGVRVEFFSRGRYHSAVVRLRG